MAAKVQKMPFAAMLESFSKKKNHQKFANSQKLSYICTINQN